jgi:glycosyltransferase involved in cell wall biosynthesis
MRVAFDHQIFTAQKYGGISRYYSVLARQFWGDGQDVKIFTGWHQNNYLRELEDEIVVGKWLDSYPPRSGRFFQALNHVRSQIAIRNWDPDVIHETYYSNKPVLKASGLRVTSAYDMIHELYPDQFPSKDQTTELKKRTFERVDHIISISHSTKRDLIRLFDVKEEKVTVVHLGVDVSLFRSPPDSGPHFDKPFLLYVGGRKGYKNFEAFIQAFSQSDFLVKEFNVIAFGGGPFDKVELELIKGQGLEAGQVRQIGGTDELLASLYHQAAAFVYPSLYEGFGLPPLEAMAAGCPVISSNTSSMPEVIGDAAEYFNPNEVEEMQGALEKVIGSNDLQKNLINLGLKNVDRFSWRKCATDTLDVYRKLMGRAPL